MGVGNGTLFLLHLYASIKSSGVIAGTSEFSKSLTLCYPAFYLVLNHTTFSQIKKGHSINYSDGFYIGLLYAVPLVIS